MKHCTFFCEKVAMYVLLIYMCSVCVSIDCNGIILMTVYMYKKGQLSLTNSRDACETFARFI